MTQYRLRIIQILIPLAVLFVCGKLFYWQIIKHDDLAIKAASQHTDVATLYAQRGEILADDGSLLAGSQETYLLSVYKPQLGTDITQISNLLAPLITSDPPPATQAGISVPTKEQLTRDNLQYLNQRLSMDKSWIVLKHHLSREQKDAIEKLNLTGLKFEPESIRFYPEASLSAHLLGFVGQDAAGEPTGYFGLEGYYDKQLQGRAGLINQETDALGNPILVGNYNSYSSKDGRTLITTINRSIQYQVEKELEKALIKYGAKQGTVIVMNPQSGAILAMASRPTYDPRFFYQFPTSTYKNPAVADLFEPGSIFKPLVMAAALDQKLIEPETKCDICDGPVHVGTYTIGTWNNKYHPGSSMTDVIVNSDNTGMVFVARKLGANTLRDYLAKYGFGQPTNIDLQEEEGGILKSANDWKDIDLDTISFGQGIAVTPIQMVTAINTIANHGTIVAPYIVQAIKDGDKLTKIEPKQGHQIISQIATQEITQMMIQAVENGEAKWARPKDIKIAGKTGTAQIPIQGHYDEKKTIASFVGFAPVDNPKFTMLVTLREPTTSPWGSETAAPTWFDIAKKIYYNF